MGTIVDLKKLIKEWEEDTRWHLYSWGWELLPETLEEFIGKELPFRGFYNGRRL